MTKLPSYSALIHLFTSKGQDVTRVSVEHAHGARLETSPLLSLWQLRVELLAAHVDAEVAVVAHASGERDSLPRTRGANLG